MDWKQFTAAMASHLAWPIVALVFMWLFRCEVAKIVQRLTNLKLPGGLEAQFDRLREKAEIFEQELPAGVKTESKAEILSFEEQLLRLAETSPLACIMLAWSKVAYALSQAVIRLSCSPDAPSTRSPQHNIKMLRESGNISTAFETLLNELRQVRNISIHNPHLTYTTRDALEYSQTSLNAIKTLDGLTCEANVPSPPINS